MVQRILIDAVHMDEVRIAIADDAKLNEFDFENTSKKQLKSNIYLGKVTRVEPSLQAVFIEYGGNRQGFLPFAEIHHDYYQIPVDDRERLEAQIAASQEANTEDDEEEIIINDDSEDSHDNPESKTDKNNDTDKETDKSDIDNDNSEDNNQNNQNISLNNSSDKVTSINITTDDITDTITDNIEIAEKNEVIAAQRKAEALKAAFTKNKNKEQNNKDTSASKNPRKLAKSLKSSQEKNNNIPFDEDDYDDEDSEIRKTNNSFYNQYKVQEVIKRNQIILVQVLKEERGNKGAFLSTYISLAGRYCVLMPNTDRAGGVSRRISDYKERNRLKTIIADLDTPKGLSVIVRTAGIDMDEAEINRDFNYLNSLWSEIRTNAVAANAPAIIHQESNLIKRSLRDLLRSNIDEVLIEGNSTFQNAKSFVKMMAPDRLKDIKEHKSTQAIFSKYNIDSQLNELYDNEARLKSGGSIVIAQTEALVAIDVNSGKSTKGNNIEDTAVSTNIEAAYEVARQLRLRDLAGLVVIDFIDMHNVKNRRAVEKALKDALKSDRAKIQTGRISIFGLMEMSRQRMHSSIIESSTQTCPHCMGSGVVRSQASTSIQLLRAITAEAKKPNNNEISLRTSSTAAFGLLNNKREELSSIEKEYDVRVFIDHDHNLDGDKYIFDKQKKQYNTKKNNDIAEDKNSNKSTTHNQNNNSNSSNIDKKKNTEKTAENNSEKNKPKNNDKNNKTKSTKATKYTASRGPASKGANSRGATSRGAAAKNNTTENNQENNKANKKSSSKTNKSDERKINKKTDNPNFNQQHVENQHVNNQQDQNNYNNDEIDDLQSKSHIRNLWKKITQ